MVNLDNKVGLKIMKVIELKKRNNGAYYMYILHRTNMIFDRQGFTPKTIMICPIEYIVLICM